MMSVHRFSNKVSSTLGTALILCALFAYTAAAATLSDYHSRVDAARSYAIEVVEYGGDGESTFEDQQAAAIKSAIPPSEKIEWSGGELETDNRWLVVSLEELSAVSNAERRADILNSISERLLGISQDITEFETAAAAANTKDEDKQKLAEILRREEYQKPQAKDESAFQRWLREFFEWLAKVFPKPQLSPGTTDGLGSLKFGLQILLYVVVIGLVAFLIYKFAPFFARRFGSKDKKEKKDRVILGERISADESAEDLFSEAEALARGGDLRGAIRKGYIAILCELSDKKVIGLARHKTNRDYLRDVRKDQSLFVNMTGLTGSFERNWYGLRPSEAQDWEDFRERYRRTIGDVRG